MIKQGKRAARITARVRAAAQTGTRSLVASFRSVDSPLERISSKLRHRSANLAAFPAMEPLEQRALFSTVTWVTNGNGDWSNAANWLDDTSVARVPTAADDVIINPAATATITVTGAQSAKSLTMTGDDTLSLTNSSLALITASDIKQLTLIGSGTVNTAADLTLSGTSSMANASVLGGAGRVLVTGTLNIANGPTIQNELRLSGTIAHTGGTLTTSGANAVVKIINGGQFNATGLSLLRTSGGQGVLVETGGTFSVVSSTVTTNGGLTINGGTVAAPNTGTSISFNGATSVTNATFNVAAGSFMAFNSNAANPVAGTIVGTGVGQVVINGSSSFSLAADTSFNFAPDQLQFQNSASIDGPGVLTSSGDINGSPVLRTKVISTGTFTANGVVNFATVDAELRITSGTSFTSTGMTLVGIPTSKGLFIEGGGTLHALGAFNTSAIPLTVLPNGVLKTTATSMSIAGVTSLDAAVFDTTAGGSIIFQPTSVVGLKGTITGTGGANTVVFGNNTGTFNTDAAGASLNLAAGMAVTNSPTFAGPGVLTITSNLTVQGTLTIQNEVRVAGTLALTAANPHLSLDGASALVRVLSGGLLAPSSNINGQTFFDNASQGIKIDAGGKLSRNSSGQLNINTPVDNLGTIESLGGNIVINGNIAQLTGTAGNYTLGGGTWVQKGVSFFNVPGKTFTRIGATATVVVGAGPFNFPPTLGIAEVAGTLRVAEGRALELASTVTNSGSVILEPGTSIAVGSYSQTSTGSIEFQIAGTTPTTFGKINGSSSATLDGRATITLANGFVPTEGQSFTLQNFASRSGTFANVQGLNIGGGVAFEPVYTNTAFSLNTVTGGSPNLAVQAITPPAAAVAGQDATFSYTVKNLGGATTATSWTDTIYLSKDGILDGSDVMLTQVARSGSLAADATYTGNPTVPMIGALPDNYHLIVVTDAHGQSADTDRLNNTLASSATFALGIPTLTPGVALNGVIRNGQSLFYQVTLPAGAVPTFTLTGANPGQAEIYQSLGRVPTRSSFDGAAFALGDIVQRISGDVTSAATYYVLLHGRENAGGGAPFSLLADSIGFDLENSSTTKGSNLGRASTTLSGSGFTADTTFTLVRSGGPSIAAAATSLINGKTASATFDLTGVPTGNYSIVASDNANSDTLANAFVVTNGAAGKLDFHFSAPAIVRPAYRAAVATITYQNVGGTDIDAPLFNVYGQNALMRFADRLDFIPALYEQTVGGPVGVVEVLGVSGGLAGTLSPGESGKIEILYEPLDRTPHSRIEFDIDLVVNKSDTVDWEDVKNDYRPAGTPADAWDAIFSNFKSSVGGTVGSYISRLVADANYLSQFERVSPETSRLLSFELDRASDYGSIASRYRIGALGRGLFAPLAERVILDPAGNVTIDNGVSARTFTTRGDGTFIADGGDLSTLTRTSGGIFTLTQLTGEKMVFRADGLVDYVETTRGTRATAGYTAGRLTSITDSVTGDVTSFAYNPAGRISSVTDPVGRVMTYAYDAANEHVVSITSAAGVSTFTYVAGQGPASEHAVASVTDAAGLKTAFEYDSRGRLVKQTVGVGTDAVITNFTYDEFAGVTETDAAGRVTRSFRGIAGTILRVIDAAGNVSNASYDINGFPTGVTEPTGISSQVLYGPNGLVSGIVQNDRTVIGVEYGGTPTRLKSMTSPNGGRTTHTYDAAGNLLSRLLPSGVTETFEYDSAGRMTAATNANGVRAVYTYNALGLVASRTLPGGVLTTFTYDGHRNLTSATDANGTTTYTYNLQDRLTSATYPNGKSVTFTYDASGRRATVADQSGYTTRYVYDSLGRVTQVRDTGNALLVQYGYSAAGELISETRGNGSSTDYGYDLLGRVASITHRNAASAVIETLAYTYDVLDRVKTFTDSSGVTTYSYDLNGQLALALLPGGRSVAYQYDANGNRTAVVDSLTGTDNYTTNAADQYTSAGAESLTYDAAGRIISRTKASVTTTYTYDVEGKMLSIVSPGNSVSFIYDAMGNRIGQIENGVQTDFSIDPASMGSIFGEYNGAATIANYAIGLGVAAQITTAGTSYYHFDVNGNTAALTGSTGTAIANYRYLPFGRISSQSGAVANRFTYGGRDGVQDDSGDLYYMRFRSFDAGLGRFVSRDPIGILGGDVNLYRFANNDPINSRDPLGLRDYYFGYSAEVTFGGGDTYIEPVIGRVGGISASFDGGDHWDSGLYYTYGSTEGVFAGTGFNAGWANEISGEAVVDNYAVAIGTYSNIPNSKGGSDGKSYGLKAELPVGKSRQKTTTEPLITARGISKALGYDPNPGILNHQRLRNKINNDRKVNPKNNRKPAFDLLFKKFKKEGFSDKDAYLKAKARLNQIENTEIRRRRGGSWNELSMDPNDIIGPAGFGADVPPDIIAPGQFRFEGFVLDGGPFDYRIQFENKPTAGVPAQVVTVTHTLDTDLDLSTFTFENFGFGSFLVTVPDSAIGTSFSTVVDAVASLGVNVRIDAELNTVTRVLTIVYTSLDPVTNDIPLDPTKGFLPPNNVPPQGDGFATFKVRPNAGLPSGTRFDAIASIVFDTEAPIATPTIHNLLDTAGPTSAVTALPATVSTSSFNVGWTGQDGSGSGIASYDVYVSDNGGAYTLLLDDTTLTSTLFTGLTGHTYRFYSVATDRVGNVEAKAENAEATTTVTTPINVPAISINDVSRKEGNNGTTSFAFTLTRTGNLNGISTVRWATADGTAELAKNDYRAAGGTVTFGRGVATKKITVLVNGDKIPSGDETFIVNLTQPTNASIADGTGVGTIVNDDVPSPKISINDVSVAEGNAGLTAMTFRVSLDIASTSAITVKFNTSAGTANPGGDFTATTGQLTFAPGQVQKLVTVQVRGDRNREANETMFLNLHSPVNATISDRVGKGIIVNDD